MNNLSSVIGVVVLVAFFTLAVRTMDQARHTKAGVEFGPAGDRKAVKMAAMMVGGMPTTRNARVPLRRALMTKEAHAAPVIVRKPTTKSNVTEPNLGFAKDLKAEWRANVPKVPSVAGLEVPEVPNILDEPETRSLPHE